MPVIVLADHANDMAIDQCQRLLKNLEAYVEGSRIEQDLRMKAKIPTVDEFWNYRPRTSAVDVTTSLVE